MQMVWTAKLEQKNKGSINLLEKNENVYAQHEEIRYGLVTVGQEDGEWIIIWKSDNGTMETWFEGAAWEEMRTTLRRGLARLLYSGYRLMIGFIPETDIHERRMKERNEWIACYGDLCTRLEIYEQLAKWRREKASKLKRAPYWIATNRMLRMVSALVPYTLEELRQIPGFGDTKLLAYGEDILSITKPFERNTTFPLDWVISTLSEEDFSKWVYAEWELKQDQELTQLTQRRILLEGLEQGLTIKQLMEQLQLNRRELIMRIEAVESEGYNVDQIVEAELTEMSTEYRAIIEAAFIELGDEYLKPIFEKTFAEIVTKDVYDAQTCYEQIRLLRLLYRSQMKVRQIAV